MTKNQYLRERHNMRLNLRHAHLAADNGDYDIAEKLVEAAAYYQRKHPHNVLLRQADPELPLARRLDAFANIPF